MKPGQFWHLTKRATLHAGNLIVVQPEEQQRRGQSRERIFTYRSDVVVPQIQPHQVWQARKRVFRYVVDLVEDEGQRVQLFQFGEQIGGELYKVAVQVQSYQFIQTFERFSPDHGYLVTQTEAELGRRQIFERPLPDGEQIHVVYIQPLLEFLLGDVHQCAFPLAHLVTGYLLALQGLLLALGDRQQEQKNEGEDGARRSFDHLDRRPSFFTRQHSVSLAETALFDEFI